MSMNGALTQLTPADLAAATAHPRGLPALLDAGPTLGLDKMWNGLQFLLEVYAGRNPSAPDELDQAVLGGAPLGPDLGYGQAQVMQPDQVRRIAEALAAVDGPRLRACFDGETMADSDIYPASIWSEGEPVLHELMTAFVDLVAFYQGAAAAGNAMATYLT